MFDTAYSTRTFPTKQVQCLQKSSKKLSLISRYLIGHRHSHPTLTFGNWFGFIRIGLLTEMTIL